MRRDHQIYAPRDPDSRDTSTVYRVYAETESSKWRFFLAAK